MWIGCWALHFSQYNLFDFTFLFPEFFPGFFPSPTNPNAIWDKLFGPGTRLEGWWLEYTELIYSVFKCIWMRLYFLLPQTKHTQFILHKPLKVNTGSALWQKPHSIHNVTRMSFSSSFFIFVMKCWNRVGLDYNSKYFRHRHGEPVWSAP